MLQSSIKNILFGCGAGAHGANGFSAKSTSDLTEINLQTPASRIFASASNTCFAVTTDGSVYSWGSGENYVLGITNNSSDMFTPIQIQLPPVVKVSISSTHAAAIDAQGDVWTWGNQALGRELPISEGSMFLTQKQPTSTLSRPVVIQDPVLSTWEKSTPTRLELPTIASLLYPPKKQTNPNPSAPSLLSSLFGGSASSPETRAPETPEPTTNSIDPQLLERTVITDVSCGLQHTVAVTTTGHVLGWGKNSDGALGFNEKHLSVVTPHLLSIPDLSPVEQVVTGTRHTLVRTSSGSVYAAGDNSFGQLGIITNDSRYLYQFLPLQFPVDDNGKPTIISDITSGPLHSCALSTVGEVFCWGNNNQGQLGLGPSAVFKTNAPTKNSYLLNQGIHAKKIRTGGAHTAIIDQNDQLWMWGDGKHGQLTAPCIKQDTPTRVVLPPSPTPLKIQDVNLGNNTTFIILS